MSLLAPWDSSNTIMDDMNQFRRQMGRVLDRFLEDVPRRPRLAVSYPAVNLTENDDYVFVESELPGIRLEDLEISIVGRNQLFLKATHAPDQPGQVDWYCRERPSGNFERSIDLPVNVDSQNVEARLEEGVLSIQMCKSPEARPIKITVKAE